MRNKKVNKEDDRPKAPFIRSFGFVVNGLALIIMMVCILRLPKYRSFSDYVWGALIVLIFGGFAVLMFTVGYKKRKW